MKIKLFRFSIVLFLVTMIIMANASEQAFAASSSSDPKITEDAALPKASAAADDKPDKVSGFKVISHGKEEITLSWSKAKNADEYIIYQFINKKWKAVISTTETSCKIANLSAGTKYSFKIKACRKSPGKNIYSSYSKTLTACTNPARVKKLSVKACSAGSICLKWNKAAGASVYQIYICSSSSDKYKLKSTTMKTFAVIKDLKENKKYKIKIRAVKIVDKDKYYGKFSKVLTCSTKKSSGSTKEISSENARQTAFKDAGVNEKNAESVELTKSSYNGTDTYKVTFTYKDYKYTYNIALSNGDILHSKKELSHY